MSYGVYKNVTKLGCKDKESIQSSYPLTQDTNEKKDSQLDTTSENQEVSPFARGDHKAQINRRLQRHNKHKTETA